MELQTKPLLVINGEWNKSLFVPTWIGQYIGTFNQIEIPFAAFIVQNSIRFGNDDFLFFISNRSLIFEMKRSDTDIFEDVQQFAKKIAETIPHTPVDSFGINFLIKLDLTETFNVQSIMKDLSWLTNNNSILDFTLHSEIEIDKNKVDENFKIIYNEDSTISFSINYHHKIQRLAEFIEIIESKSIDDYYLVFQNKVSLLINKISEQ